MNAQSVPCMPSPSETSTCLPMKHKSCCMVSLVPGLSWDGVACTGRQPVTLAIGLHGVVASIEMPHAGSGKMISSFAAIVARFATITTTTLKDLMVALAEAGRGLGPMLFQLGFAVGSRLEAQLLTTVQASCQGSAPPGKKEQAKGLAKAMAQHMKETRDQRLHQYFYSSRQAFQDHQFMGFSMDFSRTGNKKTAVGCMSTPGNSLGWCPPQVLSQSLASMYIHHRLLYEASLRQLVVKFVSGFMLLLQKRFVLAVDFIIL